MTNRDRVLGLIEESVADLIYYDRKHDEDLPLGEIEKIVSSGEVTIDEIVNKFRFHLEKVL